jgi:hypothetical protein
MISFNVIVMRLMPIYNGGQNLVSTISDEDKLDAEARLFYLFEEACGQKKELQNALQLDSKFVSFILNECCVRQNKHKWALHPDYTVDF